MCDCPCHGTTYTETRALIDAMRPAFGSTESVMSVVAHAILSGYCAWEDGSLSYSLINDSFRLTWFGTPGGAA